MEQAYCGDGRVSKSEIQRANGIVDSVTPHTSDVDYWRAAAIASKMAEIKAKDGYDPFRTRSTSDLAEKAFRSVPVGKTWTDYYNSAAKSVAFVEDKLCSRNNRWGKVFDKEANELIGDVREQRVDRENEQRQREQERYRQQREREYERETRQRGREFDRLRCPPGYYGNCEGNGYDSRGHHDNRPHDHRHDRRQSDEWRERDRQIRDLNSTIRNADRLFDSIRNFGR